MSAGPSKNRLGAEPSLYLRQHAGNPVDWNPWDEIALERSRSQDKPILLSIGYSACHWCHVMEHESFTDPAIAALMNEQFVCIKVDREERPDLDALYMKAVQAMTGHGGWPMTVFLTPDGKPYYAGTYFPPVDRGGMPGFPRVLTAVAAAYRDKRKEIEASGDRVVEFLRREPEPREASEIDDAKLREASRALAGFMDAEHGGFGKHPKFPGSMSLSFMMAVGIDFPDPDQQGLIRLALDRMAAGGIYDHLGGGFHRYSVDRLWRVPHFEKMLYDQALLAPLYTQAWQAYGDTRYRETAEGILDYVIREMTSPDGGFYATQDADSEGEEGKFFAWTPAAVAEVVGEDDAQLVCRYFGVTEQGDFEGGSVLHLAESVDEVAVTCGRSAEQTTTAIEGARRKLLEARSKRIAPGRDEKSLADWNGMMISAMARCGQVLGREDFVDTAAAAADFVRARMYAGGRLQHFYADGEVRVPALLDDLACFGRGCLDLFFARGRREDFESARDCAQTLLADFEDPAGGFRLRPASSEPLVASTREMSDGAVPSGNSVACELTLRLYQLTGEDRYRSAGEAVLECFAAEATVNPYSAGLFLSLARSQRRGFVSVVPVGEGAAGLAAAALAVHCPEASVLNPAVSTQAHWLPAAVRGKKPESGRALAYVCRGQSCGPPIGDSEQLATELRRGSAE